MSDITPDMLREAADAAYHERSVLEDRDTGSGEKLPDDHPVQTELMATLAALDARGDTWRPWPT